MRLTKEKKGTRYYKKKFLMSKLEQEFYNCLCQLLSGEEYIVQPKVCLSSVLEGAHKTFLNEIADFCVFNREYEPLLIIEINGEGRDTIFSFRKKGKCLRAALEAAGLPCMRLWSNYGANMKYIEETLREYMQFIYFS